MKRKIYAARNLKDTFKQVGMQLEYLEEWCKDMITGFGIKQAT
jgi:hypothetical protein